MQLISIKRQVQAWLSGKDNQQGIVQETEISPHKQMIHAQNKICSWKWNT